MADDAPAEDDLEQLKAADAKELHRVVREEGEAELERPAQSLFWSGLAAGIAINASLLAEAALHMRLPDTPVRPLIEALGYPMGFLVVILGRMQLFTESTITAMLPLVFRPSGWALRRTLRLWGIVLGANMFGTALAAGCMALGLIGGDGVRDAAVAVSSRITELNALDTFVNAIPAGFLIAIVAWVLPNAREQSFVVIFAFTYVIAIAGFSHSVVGGVETFLLLMRGAIGPGQAAFAILLPAIFGNLLGGAGIFALLAHAQVKGEMKR